MENAEARTKTIALAAFDKKGYDITAVAVGNLVFYTEYFLVVTARSDHHVKAVARHIEKTMAAHGIAPVSTEGYDFARWVLLDFGSVMVHVFLEPLRKLYELERLWADAPRLPLDLPAQPPPTEDDLDDLEAIE